MTVFRIQESSTTLIDNALGKTESDAGITNTSKTLDKGIPMDRQDQGLIQKLMQNSKTYDNHSNRSRGTNFEKKAGMKSNA